MPRARIVIFILVLILGAIVLRSAQQANPPGGITRQAMEARLKDLEAGRDHALADYQAYVGAIQECKYWMGQLDAAEQAKTKK